MVERGTLHVHTAGGGKGYTLHVHTAGVGERDTPCASKMQVMESDIPLTSILLVLVAVKGIPITHCSKLQIDRKVIHPASP